MTARSTLFTAYSPMLDRPVIVFFSLAFLIGWALMQILVWIARDAGLDSWISLSQIAESWSFDNLALTVL